MCLLKINCVTDICPKFVYSKILKYAFYVKYAVMQNVPRGMQFIQRITIHYIINNLCYKNLKILCFKIENIYENKTYMQN